MEAEKAGLKEKERLRAVRPLVRFVGEAISWVESALLRVGIKEARREAELMAAHILKTSLGALNMRRAEDISAEQFMTLKAWVERRGLREPLYYILGECEFWSLNFKVTPDVLIPRPETELLVEGGLVSLKGVANEKPIVLDLCTGSGCVAISIKSELPGARVYATDISRDALAVAKENAELNGQGSVEFFRGDLFDAVSDLSLQGKFDLIVSNPPYIPAGDIDGLQREVADYEPRAALDGGPDGLDIISSIVRDAPLYLKSGGALLFEVGQGQALEVAAILSESGSFKDVLIRKDYSGIERIVSARRV